MKSLYDLYDRIYCIHYSKQTQRLVELYDELKRVGIGESDRFTLVSEGRSEYRQLMYDILKGQNYKVPSTINVFNVSLSHYEVINSALEEGLSTILILENDVRFLKDADKAREILMSFNESNSDCVLFDRFIFSSDLYRESENVKFVHFTKDVFALSCYALNRVGMVAFVKAFNEQIRNKQIIVCDDIHKYTDCTKAFSVECACIQKQFGDANNLLIHNTDNYSLYGRDGVDISRYNI